MAYALVLERIDQHAMVERQVVGFALVMGAKGVDLPDPDAMRIRFEEWLVSPLNAPVQRTPEQRALRKVLLGHE